MRDLREQKQAICEALARGETWVSSAEKGGISYDTCHRWIVADPEFETAAQEARTRGRELRAAELEAVLHQGANKAGSDSKFTAQLIFALKNLRPGEWRDEQHQHISGAGDGPIQVDSAAIRKMFDDIEGESSAK